MVRFSVLACVALVAAIVLSAPEPAQAGCQINVGVKNVGDRTLRFSNSSSVKSKGGWWRRLRKGMWAHGESRLIDLEPDARFVDGYLATFRCGAKRRYRFTVSCFDHGTDVWTETYHYYPGPTTWTTEQTFTAKLTCTPGG